MPKPNTLLYEQAAANLGISLAESFVIGNSLPDVEAALRFGGKGCLVGGRQTKVEHPVFATLSDAVSWILNQPQ